MGQIRNYQTDYLRKGSEEITYQVYDYEGTFKESLNENILFHCPTQAKPLYKDLVKQYEKPYNKVEFSTALTGKYFVNENAHFLYGDHRWSLQTTPISDGSDLTGSTIDIRTDANQTAKAVSGNRYAFTDILHDTGGNPLQFIATERQYTIARVNRPITVEFDYYIKTTGSDEVYDISFKGFLQETYSATASSGNPYHYNFDDGAWNSGVDLSKFKVTETTNTNVWGKATITMEAYKPTSTSVENVYLSCIICLPELIGGGTGGFEAMYVDNFRVFEDYSVQDNIIARRTQYGFSDRTYTGYYKSEGNVLSNEAQSTEYFIGKINGYFRRTRDTADKTLEQIITQEIINDSRDYLTRYEGTFITYGENHMGLHNKIWIDFGEDVLQEPVACYLDAMKYNVKDAEYSIRMHVPNQDDDLGSSYNVFIE